MMVMEAEQAQIKAPCGVDFYFAGMDGASRDRAFMLAEKLRGEGASCEVDLMDRSLKAQFKYADKIGARFVVVIGESELKEGAAEVKEMKTSSSARVKFDELAQYYEKRRNQDV